MPFRDMVPVRYILLLREQDILNLGTGIRVRRGGSSKTLFWKAGSFKKPLTHNAMKYGSESSLCKKRMREKGGLTELTIWKPKAHLIYICFDKPVFQLLLPICNCFLEWLWNLPSRRVGNWKLGYENDNMFSVRKEKGRIIVFNVTIFFS